MKRTPKSLLAILCSFAVLLSGLALWSSAAGTPEVLNPVVGTTYQLTGSAGLPGQSFDQQGDFGISYLAMDQGVLKEATYKAANNCYFYWDGADSVCSYIFPAQWENAMRAIPTATTYPVIAFTFPKTGTVNFTFGGASDPANSMTLYVTKNGVADADKLTATEGVYTEQVQAGDVFYCHCKPNNYTAGMYCAPGATVTYTAFAPEALNPELNTTYQLTGSAGLPGQSFDQQGDFGISYLAMDQGVLKEATYKAADNGYFYWDGADSVCSYIFPAQWENAMRAIPTATTYPVIAFTFPKTGTVNFTFGGASDPANSMTLYVTKNGVADADKLTATEGVYTEQVQAGDVFYCHCKPNNYTAGMYCAPGATVTYTLFGLPAPETEALEEAIAEAEALVEAEYTTSTWADLAAALADAKAALENATTQNEVDTALAALDAAMDALEPAPVAPETEALEEAIAEAEALVEAEYTTSTWADLAAALADAKAALENATTQNEVDTALAALDAAMDALEPAPVAPETEALEGAIAEAEALVEAEYTTSTWADLVAALADAKAALENATTQNEVDTALAALDAAMDALEPAPVNGDDTNDDDTNNDDTNNDDTNNDDTNDDDKNESPDTGDVTVVLPMALAMVALLVAGILLFKKIRI